MTSRDWPGDGGRNAAERNEGGRDAAEPGGGGLGGLDLGRLRRELAGAPDGSRLSPLGLGRVVTGAGAADGLAGVAARPVPARW